MLIYEAAIWCSRGKGAIGKEVDVERGGKLKLFG
jgi:hypothetical protein